MASSDQLAGRFESVAVADALPLLAGDRQADVGALPSTEGHQHAAPRLGGAALGLLLTRIMRGGRFVTGFTGEQYALPHAIEMLNQVRKTERVARAMAASRAL